MTKKEKACNVLNEMEKLFPNASSELANWDTPFQYLIAVILSAQTTDSNVNSVTGRLFMKYPDADSLMHAKPAQVEKIVRSVNYYRTKSKNIIKTARMISTLNGGEVPRELSKLIALAGVGLKTANVFLNEIYRANDGIGADTHVMRVSRRLGLSNEHTPATIAHDLENLYRRDDWYKVNTLFVLYGRYYCKARVRPENSECIFKSNCSHCGRG